MDINSEITTYLMRGGYRENDPYILTPEEREHIQRLNSVYEEITQNFPLQLGMDLSNEETEKVDFKGKLELTYGEVEFLTLAELFCTLKARYDLPQGGIFYDLGSGTGKCVVGAALLHEFDECRGIEILENLFKTSLQLQEVFRQASNRKISFVMGDILTENWADASFIFVNGTCMSPEILKQLGDIPIRPGTLSLSLTNSLPAENWKILEKVKNQMSWGTCTVFIQRRVDPQEDEELRLAFARGLESD